MVNSVYAIDDFPGDALLWRIEWIGGVGYKTSVPSDPQIEICLPQEDRKALGALVVLSPWLSFANSPRSLANNFRIDRTRQPAAPSQAPNACSACSCPGSHGRSAFGGSQ